MSAKKVGPAYKEITRKYAGQKDAADELVQNILEGGTGVWGNVPMPATKIMGVIEADARKLVGWYPRSANRGLREYAVWPNAFSLSNMHCSPSYPPV